MASAAFLWSCTTHEPPHGPDSAALQARLEELQAQRAYVPGFAVVILRGNGRLTAAATGVADSSGTPMTTETPVRMASITKTFVAAAVLRLAEEGMLELDAPIQPLLAPDIDALLSGDGYDTGAISVRHILMHAAGLGDHFGTDAFVGGVLADPERVWTAKEQLALMTELTDPLSQPGEAFAYSDGGYIVLGHIIERATGEPLGAAVRRLTKLDALGLQDIRWEGEAPAEGLPTRAHQYVGGIDTYGIHGSVDAFGGGGIVANAEDLARFFSALFAGEVFEDPGTLALMTSAPGHPPGSPYRLGLFETQKDGLTIYGHGGFWGTDVGVVPARGVTFVAVALEREGMGAVRDLAFAVATGEGTD
jgi:D-alanyl-D-alanine carboxypeptidase